MAPTRIADVVVPEVFNPYVSNRTLELSAIYQSGIVANNPELNRLAASGGRLINMPYWEDLTGDDEVLSDTTALTPQNITAGQDVAVLLLRGKAWSTNDLAGALAGSDPMTEIGDKVASFWARKFQQVLLSTLAGAFASGTLADNTHDISAGTGNANKYTAASFVDALQKLGDAKDQVTAVLMHSAVQAHLTKLDLIETERQSTGAFVQTFMGKRVIVDDALAPSGSNYTTYIFGPGAIGYGNGGAPVPTETDRDSLAGDDILVNRQHFVLHPRGVAFQDDSVAGPAPTNAELANGDNWARVYDANQVRIVRFVHQIGDLA